MTGDEPPLDELARVTGRNLVTLSAARERSRWRMQARVELLARIPTDDDTAVVMLGSWARREITSGSDDDLMVLVHSTVRGEVRPSVDAVATVLGTEDVFRPPGPEGIFGEAVFSSDLVNKIGLDRDTNKNLTRRMLVLLESAALTGEPVLTAVRRAVLDGYLRETTKDFRPPRFLLNDLVRYWRTIGVDFVGKVRERDGQGWGLRNAKLRTSRKVLFASGLLAVLRCHEVRKEEMLDFLDAQFAMPAMDRLASAYLRYGSLDHGAAAIVAYDQFLQLLDDAAVRAELNAIDGARAAARSEHFDSIARLGVSLDQALLGLLFGPALARWTRDFAIL